MISFQCIYCKVPNINACACNVHLGLHSALRTGAHRCGCMRCASTCSNADWCTSMRVHAMRTYMQQCGLVRIDAGACDAHLHAAMRTGAHIHAAMRTGAHRCGCMRHRPAGAQASAGNAVPRLVLRQGKY